MDYIHIPVDFKKPETGDLVRFFQAMNQNKEKNILVHCAYNWRVSSFVYLYRVITQDCDEDTAKQDMLDVWDPDETWQSFIDACLANIDALNYRTMIHLFCALPCEAEPLIQHFKLSDIKEFESVSHLSIERQRNKLNNNRHRQTEYGCSSELSTCLLKNVCW